MTQNFFIDLTFDDEIIDLTNISSSSNNAQKAEESGKGGKDEKKTTVTIRNLQSILAIVRKSLRELKTLEVQEWKKAPKGEKRKRVAPSRFAIEDFEDREFPEEDGTSDEEFFAKRSKRDRTKKSSLCASQTIETVPKSASPSINVVEWQALQKDPLPLPLPLQTTVPVQINPQNEEEEWVPRMTRELLPPILLPSSPTAFATFICNFTAKQPINGEILAATALLAMNRRIK